MHNLLQGPHLLCAIYNIHVVLCGRGAFESPQAPGPGCILRVSMWVSDGGLTLKNTVPLRGKLSDYAA